MNTFFPIVLGQIISLFGNAALRFALPLYLLRQTDSAALYGGITALAMLPALAGMLTGGALADRCRKTHLMALLDLVTAGIAAAAAAGLPYLPLLPLILTVLGSLYAIQGLYQPVVRACLPLLLNDTQLLRGNAVIQLVDTVDELLGPQLGIRGLLALCGGCFTLSAGMELCLHIPQDVPCDTKLSVRSLWADLRESTQFLTGQAAVLRLAAAMAAVNLLEVPALTVGVPVLVVQTLQKRDASLGLVQAVLSAGGILGGVLAGTVFVRHPIRSGTRLLLALSGVCAALGLALRVPTLQFGSILVLGAVFMAVAALFNVWFFAQLQVLVPQAQLGKTTACISVLACLTQPIGQAAYGSAFQHWAAHPADVLLAAGVLSALVLWLLQTRRTA
jgi:MFS family permease